MKEPKKTDKKSINDESPFAFEPIIVDTVDVADELKRVSTVNNVDLKLIDFHILNISTSYYTPQDEEPKWLEEKQLNAFDDDSFFLNPDLKIDQHFKIEIFDKRSKVDTGILPNLTLGANKNLTKIVVGIKQNLNIKYFHNLEERLIEEINKRKIRSSILVGIREAAMREEIRKLVAFVRVNNYIEKDITLVVMEGVEPLYPVNDNFIEHFKKKVEPDEKSGRVDYSRRGFLQSVGEKEIILEYIKPQEGSPGKNCRGVYLPVNEPKIAHDGNVNIGENIEKIEDDKSIKFLAKRSGYVKFENGVYDVQEEMEIGEINFKTTGSIEAGLDKNIKINIKEADALTDAVGTGMSVESTELNVDGNVGSQANIRARLVRIGGQTHKTSNITADSAQIAVHRGNLEAKEVNIDRLEGGTVVGDVVRIKMASGGEVFGREVYIEELFSHAQITASELIEIKKLKGSNNRFAIDSGSSKAFSSDIASLKEKIKEYKKKEEQLPKQLEGKKLLIDANKASVEMIKDKIAELRSENIKPPATFLGKLKEYQQLINEYNILLKQAKEIKVELQHFNDELNSMQNKIFDAKIINYSPWLEYNEIKFKLISPEIEITYNTIENETTRVFTLIETADDGYRINRSSEIRK